MNSSHWSNVRIYVVSDLLVLPQHGDETISSNIRIIMIEVLDTELTKPRLVVFTFINFMFVNQILNQSHFSYQMSLVVSSSVVHYPIYLLSIIH